MHRKPVRTCLLATALAATLPSCQGDDPAPGSTEVRPAPAGETRRTPRHRRIPTVRFSGSAMRGESRRLRVPDIESVGVVSLDVFDPYTEKRERYTGVPLPDLVAAFAPEATRVLFTAIDDYQVKLTVQEWREHEILLATQHKRAHLTVASKGPVRIIFKHSESDRETIAKCKPKWIWQITKIEFVK